MFLPVPIPWERRCPVLPEMKRNVNKIVPNCSNDHKKDGEEEAHFGKPKWQTEAAPSTLTGREARSSSFTNEKLAEHKSGSVVWSDDALLKANEDVSPVHLFVLHADGDHVLIVDAIVAFILCGRSADVSLGRRRVVRRRGSVNAGRVQLDSSREASSTGHVVKCRRERLDTLRVAKEKVPGPLGLPGWWVATKGALENILRNLAKASVLTKESRHWAANLVGNVDATMSRMGQFLVIHRSNKRSMVRREACGLLVVISIVVVVVATNHRIDERPTVELVNVKDVEGKPVFRALGTKQKAGAATFHVGFLRGAAKVTVLEQNTLHLRKRRRRIERALFGQGHS